MIKLNTNQIVFFLLQFYKQLLTLSCWSIHLTLTSAAFFQAQEWLNKKAADLLKKFQNIPKEEKYIIFDPKKKEFLLFP